MKSIKHVSLSIISAVVLLFTGIVSAAEKITHYHFDALGSPVAATDAQGTVIWRETYQPYGERIQKQPTSSSNARWYTGHVEDQETGLSYAGARYYDASIGRFYAVDPKTFTPNNIQSFNRFAYANNNPYSYTDPDGRSPWLLRLEYTAFYEGASIMGARALGSMLGIGIYNLTHNEASNDTDSGANSSTDSKEKPNLVEPDRARHILDGDETGGGHRAGTGKPGKSEFPSDWSDEKVLGEISDVATASDSSRSRGRRNREVARGTRDGVDIETVSEPNGQIVTGYPTNAPRNPK